MPHSVVPMYYGTHDEAIRNGDRRAWSQSNSENARCILAIDSVLLTIEDTVPRNEVYRILSEFGYDRCLWCMSLIVRTKGIYFSETERKWAEDYCPLPRSELPKFQIKCDPWLLPKVLYLFLEMYSNLHLYNVTHCIPDSIPSERELKNPEMIKNRIYVIKPTWLSNDFKRPQYQLFRATDRPSREKKCLIGSFLYDGDLSTIDGNDILGELNPEFYPDWLKEKIRR